ncbi:DUF2332 family protein [Rhodococcus qingshengii]|nr:DUF2332 family protein [Rhodococcus qingshengii]
MLSKEVLSQKFTTFAENECKGTSELYEFLALEIAKDDELLELCTNARNGQPVPNLLFGAVHYLLLKGFEHKLKEFYPSIVVEDKKIPESDRGSDEQNIKRLKISTKEHLFKRVSMKVILNLIQVKEQMVFR